MFNHDITSNFPFIPIPPAGVGPNGQAFLGIQALLIGKPGPYQGWVFLLDHAPRQPSNPAYQRYALIKPGDPPSGASHVFINRTFTLPEPNQRSAQYPEPAGDFFCSHHVQTEHGNVFIAGGTVWNYATPPPPPPQTFDGSRLAYIWDPALDNGTGLGWFRQPDLQQRRYYPTVIVGETRGDGFQRFYVAGGLEVASNLPNGDVPSTYEVYKLDMPPHSAAKDVFQGSHVYDGPRLQTQHPQAATFHWYPWLHLLSDGQFFMAGFAKRGGMARHDPLIQTQWNMGVGALPNPPYIYGDFAYAHYGSSVLLPINFNALAATRDRVLRMGGQLGGPGTRLDSLSFYLDDVDQCSPLGGAPNWQPRNALVWPRKHANAVLLPDESILVVGGENAWGPVYDAERLVGDNRVKAGTVDSVRDYHSIALLLPDGRVFVGGGNNRDYDYQIYAPPYLFAGSRPVITGWLATNPPAPTPVLNYGQTFTVKYTLSGTSAYAAKVVMMRPGSTTHHYDSEQRLLELQHVNWPPPVEGTLQVQAPPNSSYAPKGYYMLFVITNTGVPSVATWVKLQ